MAMGMGELIGLRRQRDGAFEIVCAAIGCGWLDVECIIEMEENFPGTIERAIELKDELGELNFGNFVLAVKEIALEQIEDELLEISEDIFDALQDMVIDDNYAAWGGIACYGSGGYHDVQEAFADYVYSGSGEDKERVLELARAYKEFVVMGI